MRNVKALNGRSQFTLILSVSLIVILLSLLSLGPAQAAGYSVTNTNDAGAGSLRSAINQANSNPGHDIITFAITGCGGPCTIQLESTLYLSDLAGVTIDGYSQTGAAQATGSTAAIIRIELDGTLAPGIAALVPTSNNVIKGLAINRFSTGTAIAIAGTPAIGNTIRGCFIGTDSGGTTDLGNYYGIQITNSASGNVIGGTLPAHRNIISGNDFYGVSIATSSTANTVSGNYIGTTANGLTALGNSAGIELASSANNNTIGGSASGAGNLISGNTVDGIVMNGSTSDPHDNTIEDNWIGVDVTGAVALANGQNGIQIYLGAYSNTIGPDNIISGNVGSGIDIHTEGTNGNAIKGNFIGTDLTGTVAIPNGAFNGGIFIHNAAQGTVIGGDTPAERNLISGNTGQGVHINGADTDFTTVSGNYIGLDITGTTVMLNGYDGVSITNDAANSTVGGDTSGQGNVIVGHNSSAVKLENGANNNIVSGNLIGTDISGTVGMGAGTGVVISYGANNNTIGGTTLAKRNVISGNGGRGIHINGPSTDDNQVLGNFIGVDITGSIPLSNSLGGIQIWDSARNNTIGPNNIIANNGLEGIRIYGADTDFNIFTQNSIYAHTNYNISLPFTPDGSNEDIKAPWIDSVNFSPLSVSGTTTPDCLGCTIEVFTSFDNYPAAGRTYLGTGTTDGSGNWTVSTPGLHGPYISATLTDATKGTSMYSNCVETTITALYLPLIMR
jgi:hypothetical protein